VLKLACSTGLQMDSLSSTWGPTRVGQHREIDTVPTMIHQESLEEAPGMVSRHVLNLSADLQRNMSCFKPPGLQDVAETAIQLANDFVILNRQRSKCGHDPKGWWRLVWCHERCHKPEHEDRCHTIQAEIHDLGASLVCLKKASKFACWLQRAPRPLYVLITDWREAQPCVQFLGESSQQPRISRPAFTLVLCSTSRQASRAAEWVRGVSSSVGPVFVCESSNVPASLLNGLVQRHFGSATSRGTAASYGRYKASAQPPEADEDEEEEEEEEEGEPQATQGPPAGPQLGPARAWSRPPPPAEAPPPPAHSAAAVSAGAAGSTSPWRSESTPTTSSRGGGTALQLGTGWSPLTGAGGGDPTSAIDLASLVRRFDVPVAAAHQPQSLEPVKLTRGQNGSLAIVAARPAATVACVPGFRVGSGNLDL